MGAGVRDQVALPADAQLRQSCPAIWNWYDSFFPDAEHPVRSRLVLALIRRQSYLQAPPGYTDVGFPQVATTLRQLLGAASPQLMPYWQQHREEFLRVYNEARDLLTWLHPERVEPAWEVLRLHTTKALHQQGVPFQDVLEILPKLSQVRRGAPAKASMRIAAVKALELKMADSKNSWTRVTLKVCPCGNRGHNHRCAQLVRQAVMRLKKALTKYGV